MSVDSEPAGNRDVTAGASAAGAAETVLLAAAKIYRWRGRTMGRTIFRTHMGTLLLTTERLLFLSSGSGDMWRRMAWVVVAGVPGPVGAAATVADAVKTVHGWVAGRGADADLPPIDPAELRRDGSLSVPLVALEEYGVTRRRFASFLWIAYGTVAGQRLEFTFSNQVAIPGGELWESTIRTARSALLSD